MNYTIHPLVMGTKVFDKGMMTYQHQYGQPYTIPIYCWYVEGGDKVIIIDSGEMHPIKSEEREQAIGGPILTFEEGLAKFGKTPEDVDIIIHTHLHNDHCENDYKCVNARIYVHEKELEAVHNPHPLDYRYLEDYIEDVEENGQLEVVTGDTEVVPGITMIHTPAHTEGGMSIKVETKGEGAVVITGFCVINENLNPPPEIRGMEMDVIPPGTNTGPARAYDILTKVKGMADKVICLHEPEYASGTPIG